MCHLKEQHLSFCFSGSAAARQCVIGGDALPETVALAASVIRNPTLMETLIQAEAARMVGAAGACGQVPQGGRPPETQRPRARPSMRRSGWSSSVLARCASGVKELVVMMRAWSQRW